MKKSIIITSMIVLLSGAVYAQPTGEQSRAESAQQQAANPPTGSLSFLATLDEQAEASSNVDSSASKYITAKGWIEGVNDKGLYVAKGSANIKKKPTDKSFELARSLAFQEAMAEAKSSIARFYGQEIQTRLEHIYAEPASAAEQKRKAEAEAGIDPSMMSKFTDLINAKIDKELAKEGVSSNSPKAKDIIENLLSSSSLTNYVTRTSAHQVGGLVVSKIFEEDGEIAVVAYYSPNTLSLAGAINGTGSIPKATKRQGPSVGQWVQGLSLQTLYLSQGVQVTTDDEGNIVLISYAISTGRSQTGESKKAARQKADLDAASNIRRFAGELVVTSDEKDEAMNVIELDDSSNESLAEIESSFQTRTTSVASKLNITGITSLRNWSFVDPRSKTLICGCVSMWSIKTGDVGINDRERAKAMATPAGGFMGIPKDKIDISKKKTAPTGSSYQGDANVYKAESQESETL